MWESRISTQEALISDIRVNYHQGDISRLFQKQLHFRSDNRLLSILCHLVFILMYFLGPSWIKRNAEGLF